MSQINYVIFPYRSSLYERKYGCSVRDLQVIEVIKNSPSTGQVLVVERPVSLYEVVLNRYAKQRNGHLITHSLNVLTPLKGRAWAENCYKNLVPQIRNAVSAWRNLVVLDFTPIARIDTLPLGQDFYWYDLIDNFTKHNRFSNSDKRLVQAKYDAIKGVADLITGVSENALEQFPTRRTSVMPNGLYPFSADCTSNIQYKYGFVGFVTDKFDVDFVDKLSNVDPDFSLLICGSVLDNKVRRELQNIKGVSFYGAFNRIELPRLINSFQVGLIPYLASKSHDESPIKMYEYLSLGRPVLSSMSYELKSDYILIYGDSNVDDVYKDINRLLSEPGVVDSIKDSLGTDCLMSRRVKKQLESLCRHFL